MVALLIMAKYIPYGEIVHLTAEECRVHGAELGAWLAKELAAESIGRALQAERNGS